MADDKKPITPEEAQSISSEARCARAVYDDIVRRIEKFQAILEADEKIVLAVGRVPTISIGIRGATIWFQGRNNQGCAVGVGIELALDWLGDPALGCDPMI